MAHLPPSRNRCADVLRRLDRELAIVVAADLFIFCSHPKISRACDHNRGDESLMSGLL